MNQLKIEQIADDLRNAAKYYIQDVFRDRTGGLIRNAFDVALDERGLGTCIEVPADVAQFSVIPRKPEDKRTDSRLDIQFGGQAVGMTRVVTCSYVFDFALLRVDPEAFVHQIEKGVKDIVAEFPQNASHATTPALFVEVKGFMVNWMMWGFYGEVIPETPVRVEGAQGSEVQG